MQRWEYCHLYQFSKPYTVVYHHLNGPYRVEVKRDRSKGDGNDDDAVDRTIAELGAQGWEAVCHLGQTAGILFKRPIP